MWGVFIGWPSRVSRACVCSTWSTLYPVPGRVPSVCRAYCVPCTVLNYHKQLPVWSITSCHTRDVPRPKKMNNLGPTPTTAKATAVTHQNPTHRPPISGQRRLYYSTFRALLHIPFASVLALDRARSTECSWYAFPRSQVSDSRRTVYTWLHGRGLRLLACLEGLSTHCATRHDRSQMDSAPVSAQRAILNSS